MPLFALLSKRKYFEHFMGTWGGEEGSGKASSKRNSFQGGSSQENPKRGPGGFSEYGRGWESEGAQEPGEGRSAADGEDPSGWSFPHQLVPPFLLPLLPRGYPEAPAPLSLPLGLVHSFLHALTDSFTHSLIHTGSHCSAHSVPLSFIPSLIHSFSH